MTTQNGKKTKKRGDAARNFACFVFLALSSLSFNGRVLLQQFDHDADAAVPPPPREATTKLMDDLRPVVVAAAVAGDAAAAVAVDSKTSLADVASADSLQNPASRLLPPIQKSSIDCRIEWDRHKKEVLIDHWLDHNLPILVTAIHHNQTSQGKDDLIYIIFTQAHLKQGGLMLDFNTVDWMCSYHDSNKDNNNNNNNNNNDNIQKAVAVKATHTPRGHQSPVHVIFTCNVTMAYNDSSTWNLQSVFPTTTTKTTIIPPEGQQIGKSSRISSDGGITFDVSAPLECDRLEDHEERLSQKIVGKYEEKKLGACLRFRGHQDRLVIPEWIEYHRLIGVQHFWVYINEAWDLQHLYNASYITYVPFDLNWDEHASNFGNLRIGDTNTFSQEPSQWQCLYTAKKYGYNWIITTDVDEYVYVSKHHSKTDGQTPPLQAYLKRFDTTQFASLIMNSVPYGNNTFLHAPDSSDIEHKFMIDYVWRRKGELADVPMKRYKQLYNPQKVWSIGPHYNWKSEGISNVGLNHSNREDGVFLHHFKLAKDGVSFRGGNRLIMKQEKLQLDSAMRDVYHEELDHAMKMLAQRIS